MTPVRALSIQPAIPPAIVPVSADMVHGSSSKIQPCGAQFKCAVCSSWKAVGSSSVGFRNDNNSIDMNGNTLWDRCCEGCARDYVVPPLQPATIPAASTSLAIATARAPSTNDQDDQEEYDALMSRMAAAESTGLSEADALSFVGRTSCSGGACCAAAPSADAPSAAPPPAAVPRRQPDADRIMFEPPPDMPSLSSDAARAAAAKIFLKHVEPLLPRPRTDGTLEGGDAVRLDAMLESPVLLCPPRPEQCRPAEGWTHQAKLEARDRFTMAAAGLRFVLYLPSVTQRENMRRCPLFQVRTREGGRACAEGGHVVLGRVAVRSSTYSLRGPYSNAHAHARSMARSDFCLRARD